MSVLLHIICVLSHLMSIRAHPLVVPPHLVGVLSRGTDAYCRLGWVYCQIVCCLVTTDQCRMLSYRFIVTSDIYCHI